MPRPFYKKGRAVLSREIGSDIAEEGGLHFVTLNCDQKKEAEKGPPFQKPKSKRRAPRQEQTNSKSYRRTKGVPPAKIVAQ